MSLLSGCVLDIDQVLNYEPGAISVKNNDDERHSVTVTLYKWDTKVWEEKQQTPVSDDPEIPTDNPEVQRSFTFDVSAGGAKKKRRMVVYPLCGLLIIEVELETGDRTTHRLLSMCEEEDPRSNLDIELIIDDAGTIHIEPRTGQDD